MHHTLRVTSAVLFLVFLALVAYWADTDTLPVMMRELYHFPNGDRVGHWVLYGLLAGLLIWAFPRAGSAVAVVALLCAWAVEFSQLYHAPWLDAVRQTRVGALALGQGFLWTDLVCYAVGVAGGVALEHLVIAPASRRAATP